MQIIIKKKIDEIVKKDWKLLEEKNNYLIFQTLAWHLTWIDVNDKNKDILIVIVYENKKPVIIFPFCIVKNFNIKILKWIGYDISDYLGPIADSEYIVENHYFKKIWSSIIQLIKKNCDLIILDKQVHDNIFFKNLIVSNINCEKYDETYRLDLNKWNEIKKNKNRSLQKIRWAKKKLSKLGKYSFVEKIDHADEKKKLIKKIIDWKKERKIYSGFSKSFSEKFYTNVISDKNIIISGIKINNDFIALSLGVKNRRNYLYLVPSFKMDSNLSKFSPGKILMIELIDYFESENFEQFDFCNGKEKYKISWITDKVDINQYLKSTNILGRLFIYLLKIKKSLWKIKNY